MTKEELKNRFKDFALRIIKLVDSMPNTISSQALAKQIIRSGTSPFANYRSACIAKSDKDFLNKLKMVEEELDETVGWLILISESGILSKDRMSLIQSECEELLKIITASIVTCRNKINCEGKDSISKNSK